MPTTSNWERLYATASTQSGLFTLSQAQAHGYSSQHLQKHLHAGRIRRVRRGIYRLVQFPAGSHEELVELWLWSDRTGVFSHATSLVLHELSDVLPARTHLTTPAAWRSRRLRVPDGLTLHFDDLVESECTWVDVVPVTTPARAIAESIDARLSPDLLEQAIAQATKRGLIDPNDARNLKRRLRRSIEPEA